MTNPRSPYPTAYHGHILWVIYARGEPHEVGTTDGSYDFDRSKRSGLIFTSNGSGGSSYVTLPEFSNPKATQPSFWAAKGVSVKVNVRRGGKWKTRHATAKDMKRLCVKRHVALPANPFEEANEYDSIAYCSVCKDHMGSDDLCHHLYWGEHGLAGPGSDDAGDKESFLKICRAAGVVRALRRGLVPFAIGSSQLHALGGLGPSFVQLYVRGKRVCDLARRLDGRAYIPADYKMMDGASWLLSLDAKTKKANAKTKQWLDEEVQRQNERRASGARVYAIRDKHWYGGYETDEGHYEAQADGTRPKWGVEPSKSYGAWWTHYTGRKFATRYSWADALTRLREIHAAGGRDAMIVYVPLKIQPTAEEEA